MEVKETTKFYLLGDSICFGQLISPHLTWTTRLSIALNEIPGLNRPIILQNASINGNTTRQALERMSYDITSHNPDFLMVQFGMNDCNFWDTDNGLPRVSKKAFKANLEEIVERALACGTRKIFLNTNHPSLRCDLFAKSNYTHAQSNLEYNTIIRELYLELATRIPEVTFIDVEEYWSRFLNTNNDIKLENLLLIDGIHLSKQGHDLYLDITMEKVVDQIKPMSI